MMPLTALARLQLDPARDSIAVAADVATIVVAIAVVIAVALLAAIMLRVYRMLDEIRAGVRVGLGPVSDRARSISDNVDFITQVVRKDVEALNASVQSLSDRLTHASERLEERIEEFNALMEVVQGEAEDLFLDTASTVRGVRESARAIASGRGSRAEAGEALEQGPEDAGEEGDDDAGQRERALAGAEESDGGSTAEE